MGATTSAPGSMGSGSRSPRRHGGRRRSAGLGDARRIGESPYRRSCEAGVAGGSSTRRLPARRRIQTVRAGRRRLGEHEQSRGGVPEMNADSSQSPGEHRAVKAYLFDKREGEIVEDWAGSLQHLSKSQVLWLDLQDPSQEQAADPEKTPAVEQQEGHLRVTAVAVSDAERDPDRERIVVDCFLGSNWVLTAHTADIAALDDFRHVAEGQGEIGLLDAPSFLSAVLEWVVTSYLHAFDEVEESLDEFDVKALANPSKDPEEEMRVLSTARSRVGRFF